MAKLTLLQHLESVALAAKQFSVGLAAELTQAVLDAVSELNETKADKITGKQGQIAGFDVDGRLVAQNAPTAADVGAAAANHTHTASSVGAVPTSRKVNGKPLSADISLSASDVGAAAAGHTHNYASPSHTHTAADVGARPSTWTPTAADVGAASATHTHTAADVGAAPANHTHTASDVGAAPANHTHSYLPLSGGTLTGNLTLKGSGNYGTKINLGDGDYVHISEPTDDCMEIKAKKLDIVLSDTTSGKLTVNGTALLDAIGAAAAGHSHTGYASSSHSHTASQIGLGNVPNVATNDQTPTYTQASALSALTSGEKLSAALGKIAKAVADLIAHLASKSNPHSVTAAQAGAVPTTRKVNGKALSADISLTAADVGAAAASHGTHVSYSTVAPKVDGTATAGTAGTVARSDHVHPTDTSRAPASHTHSKSQITDFPASLPASDVSAWAKAANKPSYTASEVGAAQKPLSGSITIPTTSWNSDSTATYPKYYDVAITGVTASDRASVDIASAAWSTAIACGLCPITETLAGKIRIRAATVPTAAMSANYWIEKGT